MGHVLARLRGVKREVIGAVLHGDAAEHAGHGLYLEHLWQSADEPDEVVFLFRADDIAHARKYIEGLHTRARAENPRVNLPQMTYLSNT
jgi:hypothetical protein